MKKLKLICATFVLLFFTTTKNIYAQSGCFPINPASGQIEIKGKVVIEGVSKTDIFNKCVAWGTSKESNQYSEYHANSTAESKTVKDKDAGIYKLYLQINYSYKEAGFRTILYAITIQASDGYFEYTVNDFIMNKKPMEVFLKTKIADPVYKASFDDICKKLNYTIDGLKAIK